MPLFKVLATDHSYRSAEFESLDAAAVFFLVQKLDCKEADVLVDEVYSFSISLSGGGFWSIFHRKHEFGWSAIAKFG